MPASINTEKAKKTIAAVLENIRAGADTPLLSEYHDLFRKEVSLFNRSKAAAYLLMLCDQGKSLRYGRTDSRTEKKSARTLKDDNYSAEDDSPRRPLAEEESKRLFFSAGRSRRVFPREILGLINTRTAIPKEDIGAIRILDNYSFIQVRDTVAEQIIEALNGLSFRGRPLTVNYAKSRKDEENELDASEQDQNHPEEEDI